MQILNKSLALLALTVTILTALTLNAPLSLAAIPVPSPWPADATGTDIMDGPSGTDGITSIYSGFEPSGISWSKSRNSYLVIDDSGKLAEIAEDGTLLDYWNVGSYDLEGTALMDDYSSTIYLANEATTGAIGFNLDTGALTGESWSFYPEITPSGLAGLEGLEWIPDGVHPYGATPLGGLLYAGSQVDGDIFVFEPNSLTGEDFVEELHLTSGYTDLSAIEYDEDSNIMFVAYDYLDILEERTPAGEFIASYTLPGNDQEGFSVRSDCSEGTATIAIAEDSGRIMIYNNYPITCPIIDDDDDGVEIKYDCNDEDGTVSELQTYYQDLDGDSYGNPAVTTAVCSMTPPTGYTDNPDDLYDTAKIEITGDGTDNDGDPTIDEANTFSENGPHPLYASMDAKTSYPIGKFTAMGGAFTVRYVDDSAYRYHTGLRAKIGDTCSAARISTTAYFLVNCGKNYVVVNALTGAIPGTTTTALPAVAEKWAKALVAKL